MCYAVREALWWARDGHDDLLVAYPSVDVPALAELAADPALTRAVIVMIDSVEHVDFIAREVPGHRGLRVAVDVDASLRVGPAHLGVRRSPTRTPAEVETVIRRAQERGPRRRRPDVLRRPDRRPARLVAGRAPDEEGLRRRAADPSRRGRRGRPRPCRPARSSTAVARAACSVTAAGPVAHRARCRLRALRPDPLRRLRRALARGRLPSSPSRSCADPATGSSRRTAAATSRPGRPAGRGCPARSPSRTSRWSGARAPARCRRRCGARGRPAVARRPGLVPARQGGRAGRALHGVRARQRRRRRPGWSDGPRPTVGKGSALADTVSGGRARRRVVQLGRHRVPRGSPRGDPAQRGRGRRGGRAGRCRRPEVKGIGAGHSFTGVAVTDGVQLRLGALSGVTSIDATRGEATVRAGTPLHVLNEELRGLRLRAAQPR